LPNTFVSLSRNLDAELYVKSVNAYDAYLSGRADIRYDFKRNRVAYVVKNGNNVVDAAGRAIDGRSRSGIDMEILAYLFIVASSSTAIVLEDCASACSSFCTSDRGCLVRYKSARTTYRMLRNYERVFVALDKDATDKAVSMVKILCRHVPTKLMVLQRDLKNLTKEERDEFLRSYID
jgi:hypothetical protein